MESGKSASHFPFSVIHFSFLHSGFFDEHYGDLIADRVNQTAFIVYAFETSLGFVNLKF